MNLNRCISTVSPLTESKEDDKETIREELDRRQADVAKGKTSENEEGADTRNNATSYSDLPESSVRQTHVGVASTIGNHVFPFFPQGPSTTHSVSGRAIEPKRAEVAEARLDCQHAIEFSSSSEHAVSRSCGELDLPGGLKRSAEPPDEAFDRDSVQEGQAGETQSF